MNHWICFILFICVPSCWLSRTYNVRKEKFSFEEAQNICNGFLADIKDTQQIESIFKVVSGALQADGTFQFWIGLMKPKSACLKMNQPLKGFMWTVDNSTNSKVAKWKKHPAETCTTSLCGLLLVDLKLGTVQDWGFESKACKEKHMFICMMPPNNNTPPPIGEMEIKFFTVPDDPNIIEVRCPYSHSKMMVSRDDQDLQLQNGSTIDFVHLCPECRTPYTWNHTGSCGDHCNQCTFTCIDSGTSSVCKCIKGYVQSEDGMSCKKMSAQKDPSSVTTPKPFQTPTVKTTPPASTARIITTTTTSSQIQKNYESKFNIFIPVFVALSVLVVLVVVVLVIIKCCLRKRSRNLRERKELKPKESVDLRTTDSKEVL
ncbi:hypothetical protein GN956_G23055 [Arapaima gigas]